MNDDQRDFLQKNHRAVLATKRRDGSIQMSPVLVVLDQNDEILISTSETRAKLKNLRRDGYASVLVMNDRFWGQWLEVEGPVTIVNRPEAIEQLVHYYRLASGEHPDWDEYRQAMEEEQRVLVRVQPERIVGG